MISTLLIGQSLSTEKAEKIFSFLFRGKLEKDQMKTLLLLLAKKGEETPEILGCLKVLRRLEPPRPTGLSLIDVCGTGGDGRGTFNISTVTAFVIAGAGAYVAKHGNRSVSSKVGSSDLMEALGVRLDVPFTQMQRALHQCRLGYFHAPFYHPSFSHVHEIRQELGTRTLFNLLGPFLNPLKLRYQMIGISNPRWLVPAAETLRELGYEKAAVVSSTEGLDELSTQGTSDIFLIEGKGVRKLRLDPQKLGFPVRKSTYKGGDLRTNRTIALGILENRLNGPFEDVVLLNSGFALWLAGKASSVKEGIERSRRSIRTGRARAVLETLRKLTHSRTK